MLKYKLPAFIVLMLISCLTFANEEKPSRQISFKIVRSNVTHKDSIDIATFEKIFKITNLKTESPYEKGIFEFEGISLQDLLTTFHIASYSKIVIKAVDGYKVEWSAEEIKQFSPFLAYKKNGKYLKTTDKGTFRIVMNYSQNKPKDEKKYTPKWIWQINEIEIMD